MTTDRNFKRLVRERMVETGENYTTARMKLMIERSENPDGDLSPGDDKISEGEGLPKGEKHQDSSTTVTLEDPTVGTTLEEDEEEEDGN